MTKKRGIFYLYLLLFFLFFTFGQFMQVFFTYFINEMQSNADTSFTGWALIYGRAMLYLAATQLIMLPLSGFLTDWLGNIRIIKWGALLAFIFGVLNLVLFTREMNSTVIIYLVSIGFAIIWSLIVPGLYSVIPKLVAQENLIRANSLVQLINQLVLLSIPSLALSLFFYQPLFIYLSIVLIIVTLLGVVNFIIERKTNQDDLLSNQVSSNPGEQTSNAIQVILLLLVSAVVNLPISGLQQFVLPLVSQLNAGNVSTEMLNLLLSLFGIGIVIGVIIAFFVKFKASKKELLTIMLCLGLAFALVGLISNMWLLGVILLIVGLLWGILNILLLTKLHRVASLENMGIIMSLFLLPSVLQPFVLMLAGGILEKSGASLLFIICGVFIAVIAGIVSFFLKDVFKITPS
jgi:MFS family permease